MFPSIFATTAKLNYRDLLTWGSCLEVEGGNRDFGLSWSENFICNAGENTLRDYHLKKTICTFKGVKFTS